MRAPFAIALLCASLAVATHAHANDPPTMSWQGELVDGESSPISGVFPLTFKLYVRADSTAPMWQESRFVTVQEGMYDVQLGSLTPIPADAIGRDLFLAVEIGTVGEVARQPVNVGFDPPEPTRDERIASLDVTWADLAERAVYADYARSAEECSTLAGLSVDELDRFDELAAEIAELRREVEAATGASIGTRTTTLERIGGAGGNPYTRTCPPNHVVVGMRGGAGALIDSIELICAPLE